MKSKVKSGAISHLTSFTLGPGKRTKPLSWLEEMVEKQVKQGFSFPCPVFFQNFGQREQSLIIRGEFITTVMKFNGQAPLLTEAPLKSAYIILHL